MVVRLKVTVRFVILAITAMVQDELKFLVPVLLAIFVHLELKYQNLTMIPLVGFVQEEAFVKLGSSQKNVNQAFMLMLRVWIPVKCVVLVLSALQEQSTLHLALKGTTAKSAQSTVVQNRLVLKVLLVIGQGLPRRVIVRIVWRATIVRLLP